MMRRVVHFEIHADEPSRAERFYHQVLGWTFDRWGDQPYWLISTGPGGEPGIDGGMLPRQDGSGDKVVGYVCTVDVPRLEDCLRQVEQAGGTVVMPRQAVPGVGWLAYCRDTEENIFGVMEPDERAA
ncbi:MAG: VOC family protein [Streptomycetales bacterium]